MEGWNKWCFGSGDKVRVKNTTKGAKCATDWMKLQFSVVGTCFSCFFQSSVPSKGGKKAPTYQTTQSGISGLWDVTAGAALTHRNSLLSFCSGHSNYVDSSCFSLCCHLSLFLKTLFSSFPLTVYCFPCLCTLTSPSTPNCCVCPWSFLTLAHFLPWVLLSSPFNLTPLAFFCSRVHPTSTERKHSCCLIPRSSPWSHSQRTCSCWMELFMLW